jgi:hypothetical protein
MKDSKDQSPIYAIDHAPSIGEASRIPIRSEETPAVDDHEEPSLPADHCPGYCRRELGA